MKTQKLFVLAAISCLLLGVSGGKVMAEGCGDGFLINETFDSLRVTDDECVIMSCTFNGDLRVINSQSILLLNNKVGGMLRVDGNEGGDGVANVIANTVFGGQLIVRDYGTANVIENETLTDDIRVIKNIKALVQKNLAARDLLCKENTSLDSFINFAGHKLNCE